MKKSSRGMSIILIVCMIFTVLPQRVLAKEKVKADMPKITEENAVKQEGKIVGELEEKRESNVKYFMKDDMTCEAVIYPEPVHYFEDGKWKDIDNTLVETKDESKNYEKQKEDSGKSDMKNATAQDKKEMVEGDSKKNAGKNQKEIINKDNKPKGNDESKHDVLSNKKNSFKVSIADNTKCSELVRVRKDDYELSWGLEGSNESDARIVCVDEKKLNESIEKKVEKEIEKDKKLPDSKKETTKNVKMENENKKTLKNIESTVEFSEAYPGVKLQYQVKSDNIKENIILDKKTQNPRFHFNVNFRNLRPVIQDDKSVAFFDEKDSSKIVFKMEAPFMMDANKEMSPDVKMELKRDESGYALELTPDEKWLNDEKRAYPVVIDPPVTTPLSRNEIQDTFVCSSADYRPSSQYPPSNAHLLYTGNRGGCIGVTRSYIKFSLPRELSSADTIIQANLNLALSGENRNGYQVDVHKVNKDWDCKTLLWNGQTDITDSRIADYEIINGGDCNWACWDITSIAKEWTNTGKNYGLMLKNNNEGEGNVAFYSADVNDVYENGRPQAVIQYVNNSGLENYWTYHSQSAGRAGTGYINDYNGNLTYVHNDLAMSGNRMPVNINHVYNSNDVNHRYEGFAWIGKGWTLNVYQHLLRKKIGDATYYEYTDEDGTRHYFKDEGSNELKDELNMGFTLVKGAYKNTIKDKKDNKIEFDSSDGGFAKSTDKDGNILSTKWSKAANGIWIITELIDGGGRVTKLSYDDAGNLTSITDPAQRTTKFQLDSGKQALMKITYPDNNFTEFQYDANFNLTSVKNFDGLTVSYQYSASASGKVVKTSETCNGTSGQEMSIAYSNNSTEFTDFKGKKETYTFDNSGKTVNVKDWDDSALYYKYTDGNNITKVGESSKVQKTISNHLINHDAEMDSAWRANADGAGYSKEEKYMGGRSLKVSSDSDQGEKWMAEYIKVPKGKTYTLSGYVKAIDVSGKENSGAAITVGYKRADGQWEYLRRFVSGTSDWKRQEISVNVPADISYDYLWVAVEMLNSKGTAWFDSLQLEEGAIANRYNLIEDGDFTHWDENTWNPVYWNMNGGCSSADYDFVATDREKHPKPLDTNVLRFYGKAGKQKKAYQQISTSGKAGDAYVLSGWAKADSVPLKEGRLFEISVGFINNSGTVTWHEAHFDPDVSDWQYVSEGAVAKEDYCGIIVDACYYHNENMVMFDGIQLYKEEFSTSFQYDSKGNLMSTEDLAKQNSKFEYSPNNDLIKSTDPKGNQFKYDYDDKHNVTKGTSAENVVYSFTYDSSGNPLTAKVGDGTLFMQSSAAYSDDGNYMKSMTDASGSTVNYNFDKAKGTLNSTTDAKGKVTSYEYDLMDRLTGTSKTVDGKTVKNSYAYENDRMKSVGHNGFSYNFQYDPLGNNTKVSVGGQKLIENTYEPRTSVLKQSTYGNGQTVSSDHDDLYRVISKSFNGKHMFKYQYDANGNLGSQEDLANGVSYRYRHDLSNRLSEIEDSKGNSTKYSYDLNNNLSGVIDKVNNRSYGTNYSYDKDNRLSSMSYDRKPSSDKLLACYSFDNDDISDSSGNGNNGAAHGSPQFVYGKKGKALKLDGVKDWAELTDLKVPETFSISMWVNPYTANDGQAFMTKPTSTGGNVMWFGFWGGGYDYTVRNGEYYDQNTKTTGYQHLVAVVKKIDDSHSQVKVYKNGTLLWEKTLDGVIGDSAGKPWALGQDWDGDQMSDFFKGEIDEVGIYGCELSETDVKGIYDDCCGTGMPNDKLLACYNFDNGDIADSSGNGENGTVHGSPQFVDGRNGKALKLDGVKDWGELPDFSVPETFSMSMWVNPSTTNDGQAFITKPNNTGGNVMWFGFWGGGYDYTVEGGEYYDQNTKTTGYQHLVAVVKKVSASQSQVKVYKDGKLLWEKTLDGVMGDSKGKPWALGQDWDGDQMSDFFKGEIDDVRIYGCELNQDEISRLYRDSNGSQNKLQYNYDSIGRLKDKTLNTGAGSFKTSCSYLPGVNGSTTSRVGTMDNNGKAISYTYDANGNIETITCGDKKIKHHYNELNELVREDNQISNKTFVYSYDAGGNILSKIEYNYTDGEPKEKLKSTDCKYEDSNWKDKLTSFDGKAITYDQIGNPLTYDGWSFTWEMGRQLQEMKKSGKDISFEYNDAGVRTEKTVNGKVTKYHLVGSKVTYETDGTDSIYYTYDPSGKLISMNLNGSEYFYVRNAQGDIIALIDQTGTEVATYTYDTWGKLLSVDGKLKDTVGQKNPYRYRGYRYDNEAGLYYLQSRYYNPDWGRFVNADAIAGQVGELLGHNIFAYCKNNPSTMKDPSGYMCCSATDDCGAGDYEYDGGNDYEDYPDVNSFALHPRSGGDRIVSEKKKLDHPFTEEHFWGSVTYTSYSTQKKTAFVPKTKYTKSIIYYGTPTFNKVVTGSNVALGVGTYFAGFTNKKNKRFQRYLVIFNGVQVTWGVANEFFMSEKITKEEVIRESSGF